MLSFFFAESLVELAESLVGSLEPTVNLVSFSFVDGVRVASLLPRLLDRELVPSAKKKLLIPNCMFIDIRLFTLNTMYRGMFIPLELNINILNLTV